MYIYKRFIFLLLVSSLTINLFAIDASIDSVAQRKNGTKIVDVWYRISGLDEGCATVSIQPVTLSGEILLCETIESSSDVGLICEEGSKHIAWNIGVDVPNREFYENSINIELLAAQPGVVPDECDPIEMVSGGYNFSMILKADGTLWSLGSNEKGQLGDSTFENRLYPVQVHGYSDSDYLSNIKYVECGSWMSAAVSSDGLVYAWGDNEYGQLGDGTDSTRCYPVLVRNEEEHGYLNNIMDVSCGWGNLLMLTYATEVKSCGNNHSGLLGNGIYDDTIHTIPSFVLDSFAVSRLSNVKEIEIGRTAYALDHYHNIWSWGFNYNGQLGNGYFSMSSPIPARVRNEDGSAFLENIWNISTKDAHILAIDFEGQVYSWGRNWFGQLGNGEAGGIPEPPVPFEPPPPIYDRCLPVKVHGVDDIGYLDNALAIATGINHSLAITEDEVVLAWGENCFGNLGDGTTEERWIPVHVINEDGSFFGDVIAIDAGRCHSIAIKSDGSVWTWGCNFVGELGIGYVDSTSHPHPIQVKNSDGIGYFNVYD